MSSIHQDKLAYSWLICQRHWWAVQALMHIQEDFAVEALSTVFRLVELAEDDLLGDIGAGPLEDLIRQHPGLTLERIEERATSDAKLRMALAHVLFQSDDPKMKQRLLALGCQEVGAT